MTSPVETTAAMTAPAEQHDPASAADSPVLGAGGTAGSASAAVASASGVGGEQVTERQELSLKFVITLFGGLLTALLAALVGLMMWQFNSLGARIDANGARIDSLATELRAELRAEIGSVRADMAGLGTGLRAEMRAEIGSVRADMGELGTGLRADMGELEAGLRADMAGLGTGLRADMADLEAGLRAEMQAGFREINLILLDHTDRLARLEAAAGLPRPSD
ncbi:MAG: hypothetical protein OXI97_03190 [Acidimicrobiaceae bacterium]|nr:hypothetical protein [Acidimicrobiaceae bacterium]